jgi:hypothetical protein
VNPAYKNPVLTIKGDMRIPAAATFSGFCFEYSITF